MMPQFMLLLYDDPSSWETLSPEEMQKAIEKYMAWSRKPFNVDSKRLGADSGKVMRAQNGKARTTDGPYSETKEVLGGFYLIEAASYEEAVARASDHPHLEYGGTIEVRKLYES
jgi:hypothetical protein